MTSILLDFMHAQAISRKITIYDPLEPELWIRNYINNHNKRYIKDYGINNILLNLNYG